MKTLLRILLFPTVIFGAWIAFRMFMMIQVITESPDTWDAGRGFDAVVVGVLVFGLGALALALVSFFGLFGALFAAKRRSGSFWLLVLPGAIGLILGLLVTGMLVFAQPGGLEYVPLLGGITIGVPLLFLLAGITFRKSLPKENQSPEGS